ncbi:phosphopantetheine-binding protein [Cytobacillus pseudoceanisediminis]|uniref:phosphopantetheine-binding protein n=1 Tax=Cytobacillus pseudoceanisediminis TaxID=3051614 RepID=UPI003C2D39AE
MTDTTIKLKNRIIELVEELTEEEVGEDVLGKPILETDIDSLMVLELAVHLEREFQIRLTEEELSKITKLDDILELAQGRE